ncbi:NAD(P)-specific glutamate dehydrogenase [Porphyridium purpureum]|uniref:Glutamate dehydrogenase n=1 Tax=Porphyridium purpureum TaxID=35688 RepID=A0A5J4Z9S7_PORPP|nr:NAD(P)-specific glutamate dehydrogenase [Porphyridium purpureum]|eukprot:POR6567..scf295_1
MGEMASSWMMGAAQLRRVAVSGWNARWAPNAARGWPLAPMGAGVLHAKGMATMGPAVTAALEGVVKRDPDQPEFHQAVREVLETISPVFDRHPAMAELLPLITEPERVIQFRVPWRDRNGNLQVNRGYRVQMNSALGPYKGGLRFHPSVNLSILKFLAFEQVFKNSLTTLPMGGGKGGANFDPKGKSDLEVMAFCQSFMTELSRHIGQFTDVPAGDIGVGGREIGFMFGQYKKVRNEFVGVLTGKGIEYGGSLIRPEATGYGLVYFVQEMLATKSSSLKGKTVLVSGSGNVAQYATEKVTQLGGKVVTLSDSSGFIYDKDGIDAEKLAFVMDLKNVKRGRIEEYAKKYRSATFEAKDASKAHNPLWAVKADVALPCATQNEVMEEDAKNLVAGGVQVVGEGANMPCSIQATNTLLANKVLFAPGKASNAGGVACSGLEMSQNSLRLSWTREDVDSRLHNIMKEIHHAAYSTAEEYGAPGNYVVGSNIAGFLKVARAMNQQGA